MPSYRNGLPQLEGPVFLTDGGIETTLIFHNGLELPDFAAFHLLQTTEGTDALWQYFREHAGIARSLGTGFILESATWRASPDWGVRLGYTPPELASANRALIDMLVDVRGELQADHPFVISGCVGPRGDGYSAGTQMSVFDAEAYHSFQVGVFAETGADMITAITMTYAEEAIGVARAARRARMPVAISFTVETDGRLPSGQMLGSAIEQVDRETDSAPAYYMINCAHPTHFADTLAAGGSWIERVRGVRVNASCLSHEELDNAEELDDGNPEELGQQVAALRRHLPNLSVVGGCCGTDHRHIAEMGRTVVG